MSGHKFKEGDYVCYIKPDSVNNMVANRLNMNIGVIKRVDSYGPMRDTFYSVSFPTIAAGHEFTICEGESLKKVNI